MFFQAMCIVHEVYVKHIMNLKLAGTLFFGEGDSPHRTLIHTFLPVPSLHTTRPPSDGSGLTRSP